jgi:stage V sporulation protein G
MNITSVKIYPFDSGEPDSSLRAFADVTFDRSVLVKGFRVLASKKGGLFVGFPAQRGKDGKFYDTVEIKSDSLQSSLRMAILESYRTYY